MRNPLPQVSYRILILCTANVIFDDGNPEPDGSNNRTVDAPPSFISTVMT
jgi:hypothetical protein